MRCLPFLIAASTLPGLTILLATGIDAPPSALSADAPPAYDEPAALRRAQALLDVEDGSGELPARMILADAARRRADWPAMDAQFRMAEATAARDPGWLRAIFAAWADALYRDVGDPAAATALLVRADAALTRLGSAADATLLALRGYALLEQGRHADAAEALRAALVLRPDSPHARAALALALAARPPSAPRGQ